MQLKGLKKSKTHEFWWNHLPLLKSLHAFRVQFFNSNYCSTSVLGRSLLIKPTLEDRSEASFSKNCISFKILGCSLQFCKTEDPQLWGGQDLPLRITWIAASRREVAICRVVTTPRSSCIAGCLRYPCHNYPNMVKNDINQFHKQGNLELNMQKFTWKLKKLGLCKDPNTNESIWKRKKKMKKIRVCVLMTPR